MSFAILENQTRLLPDGEGYLLSGEKFYCTGALFAHWVPVRTIDPDGNRVVAIVNRQSEGLTVIDDWSGFGQRTKRSGKVLIVTSWATSQTSTTGATDRRGPRGSDEGVDPDL